MRIAVVSTVADESERIDYFIRYHLSVGFERIYLYFDDPKDPAIHIARLYPQIHVQVMDDEWRKKSVLFLSQFNAADAASYEDEVMIRQETNTQFAIESARKEKIQWLLHIDSDELFYTREANVQEHFRKLNDKNIKNVIYNNVEALIHSDSNQKPFNSTIYFKKNHFKNNVWVYSSQQRIYLKEHGIKPEYYFHFYQNGKSAVNLSAEIRVDSVHFFRTEKEPTIDWDQHDACILHFPCPTFDSFKKKYQRLGYFSDLWRGEPRAGDFISMIHLHSRDTYLSGNGEALRELFCHTLAVDDTDFIHSLEDHDLLYRIDDVEQRTYPGDYLISLAMQRRTQLFQQCIQMIGSFEINNVTQRIRRDFFDRFNRLCTIAEIICPDYSNGKLVLNLLRFILEQLSVVGHSSRYLSVSGEPVFHNPTRYDLKSNHHISACVYTDFIIGGDQVLFSNIDYLREMGITYVQVIPAPRHRIIEESLLAQLIVYFHQHHITVCWCVELTGMNPITAGLGEHLDVMCREVFHILKHQPDLLQLKYERAIMSREAHVEYDSEKPLYSEFITLFVEICVPGTPLIRDDATICHAFHHFPHGISVPVYHRPELTSALWYSMMSMDTTILQAQTKQIRLPGHHGEWINRVNHSDGLSWVFPDPIVAENVESTEVLYRKLHRFYGNDNDQYFPVVYASSDKQIQGSTASLAGLFKAIKSRNQMGIDRSIRRILLMYSVVFSIGGMPMLFIGDESSYDELSDSIPDADAVRRGEQGRHVYDFYRLKGEMHSTMIVSDQPGRIYDGLSKLIHARQLLTELSGHDVHFVTSPDKSLLFYIRQSQEHTFLFLGNFSPLRKYLRLDKSHHDLMSALWIDILQDDSEPNRLPLHLEAYQYYWLRLSK